MGIIFVQLIVGAIMRHLGMAGLAIPSIPRLPLMENPCPRFHNAYVDLNFTHTRFGALVATLSIVWLSSRTLRLGGTEDRLARPAMLPDGAGRACCNSSSACSSSWHLRPPLLTTLHVVNGAAVLATAVLLTVRACRGPGTGAHDETAPNPHLIGATA